MSRASEKRNKKLARTGVVHETVRVCIKAIMFCVFFIAASAAFLAGVIGEMSDDVTDDAGIILEKVASCTDADAGAMLSECMSYAVSDIESVCIIDRATGLPLAAEGEIPDLTEMRKFGTFYCGGTEVDAYVYRDARINMVSSVGENGEKVTVEVPIGGSSSTDVDFDVDIDAKLDLDLETDDIDKIEDDFDRMEGELDRMQEELDDGITFGTPASKEDVGRWLTEENISMPVWIVAPTHYGRAIAIKTDFTMNNRRLICVALLFASLIMMDLIAEINFIVSLVNLARSKYKISKALNMDMITGGQNWTAFTRRGGSVLRKKSLRRNSKLAVVHIRLEKYRAMCVCCGTNKAEEIVERIYNIISDNLSSKEIVARREQADFGILMLYQDKDELDSRLKALRTKLNAAAPRQRLTFSVGVCASVNADDDPDELYLNAGLARKVHDDDESSDIEWYSEKMHQEQIWERRVEDEAEQAIAQGQFQLYLQPKYSTGEEKLSGAEALVRWLHPQDGLIPPGRFIPIFESTGLIVKLDDYMIAKVAEQQAKWIAEGKQVVPVSVNVSRAHFFRSDLAEHIRDIVDRYGVPHECIELELTESAFFDDRDVLIDIVSKMRSYGFSVSMDDFGTGYSSLNSLKELMIDVVKLDAGFFSSSSDEQRGMLVVSETIDLAKKLGMKVVAEGIETREQVDFLAGQDCDLIQGYYFAKPMPVDDFEQRAWGGETSEEGEIAEKDS